MTETEKKLIRLSLQFFGNTDDDSDDDTDDMYDDSDDETDETDETNADDSADKDDAGKENTDTVDERLKKLKELGYEGDTLDDVINNIVKKSEAEKKVKEASERKATMQNGKGHLNVAKPGKSGSGNELDPAAERRSAKMQEILSKVGGKPLTREQTRAMMSKYAKQN